MSASVHTPAPWFVCARGDYSDFYGNSQVILGDDMRIAVVNSKDQEGEANASLIAAAPDLLSLLRRWSVLDAGSWHAERRALEKNDLLIETRAAIAKATGDA